MTPRITPAPPASSPEGQALEARIRAARGEINPLYAALLNSPAVAHGWEQMLTAIRQKTGIAADLRELVILRIAVLNRAAYEFASHLPYARAAGVSEEKIEGLRTNDLSLFDGRERLVLDYAEAMTRQIEVPDALFTQVAGAFDAQGRVELTATIAAYKIGRAHV